MNTAQAHEDASGTPKTLKVEPTYRVVIFFDTGDDSKYIGSSEDPVLVASTAAGMMAGLPSFSHEGLKKMISKRRARLMDAVIGVNPT